MGVLAEHETLREFLGWPDVAPALERLKRKYFMCGDSCVFFRFWIQCDTD